jgi:hypothetical protein
MHGMDRMPNQEGIALHMKKAGWSAGFSWARRVADAT